MEAVPVAQIELVCNSPKQTAVVHGRLRLQDMPAFLGGAFEAVSASLHRRGLHVAGPPFALYRGRPTEAVEVEAGFPVVEEVAPDGDVRPGTLPGGDAVETVHTGPYDTLGETYGEMAAWMTRHGRAPADLSWESYLTDPDDTVHHPKGPQTLVVWPVRQA
ncbi:MAG TPA: GyrI-like domain-containing protein [Mycobacteriales bacterium]